MGMGWKRGKVKWENVKCGCVAYDGEYCVYKRGNVWLGGGDLD